MAIPINHAIVPIAAVPFFYIKSWNSCNNFFFSLPYISYGQRLRISWIQLTICIISMGVCWNEQPKVQLKEHPITHRFSHLFILASRIDHVNVFISIRVKWCVHTIWPTKHVWIVCYHQSCGIRVFTGKIKMDDFFD